ncbi:type VI secretion system tip protein VgrG, partial [Erwiniaceae bacterium CAU 1747]
PWAGQGWGMLAIPRIGQEVVVDFLHGDPDQPIVTGRTYHASNVPPGSLPGSKTQMAFRSKTHKGQGYNELLFEDATGAERLSLHAQKDMTTLVKNDQSLTVEGGNRTLNILAGDETKTVKQGSLTESICSLRSTRANQIQVKAEAGKSGPGTQLYESSDDITLKVGVGEIKMTTSSIKITFGGSCIQLDAGGVFIDGKVVHLNKGGVTDIQISAEDKALNFTAELPLQNAAVMSSGKIATSEIASKDSFSKISKRILQHEGGYVNNKSDNGGPTNRGISWKIWRKYAQEDLGVKPTLDNLKSLSEEQAEIIYRKRYWEPSGFNNVNDPKLALMTYDWTITSGGAGKEIQRVLHNEYGKDIAIDGRIGPKSIEAMNSITDSEGLTKRIAEVRKDYYKRLADKDPSQEKFLGGWLNRVKKCLEDGV